MNNKTKLIAIAALLFALVVSLQRSSPIVGPTVGVSSETAAAAQAYLSDAAAAFDELAKETEGGKYKTVIEAAAASDVKDKAARDSFKQAMAKIMEPKLGSEDLPADAADTFRQISNGFRKAAK